MTPHDHPSHDELRAGLAEQSLGVLDGRSRAELLTHVESCPACADELESLSAAADSLVHVAVGVEPPVGFESRTLQRIGASAASPRRARRRAPVLVAIAASLLLAFGIGWVAHGAGAAHPSRVTSGFVAERPLLAGTAKVGAAYVYTGSPSWMFVTLSLPGGPASVRCTAISTSGRREVLGTFALTGGKGAWGTPVGLAFRSIRSIELSSPGGTVVARMATSQWSYPSSGPEHSDPAIPRAI